MLLGEQLRADCQAVAVHAAMSSGAQIINMVEEPEIDFDSEAAPDLLGVRLKYHEC